MNKADARLISQLIYDTNYSGALSFLVDAIDKQDEKNKELERRIQELEVANENFKYNVAEVIAKIIGNLAGSPYAFANGIPFDLSQTRDLIMQALDNGIEK